MPFISVCFLHIIHQRFNYDLSTRAGTPHSHHYSVALAALNAGKHVLCEKPVTLNAAELRALITVAKQRKLFFMEALWTRFQPLVKQLMHIVGEGRLGSPVECRANLLSDFMARGVFRCW
jgi:predicted dehydrogenase